MKGTLSGLKVIELASIRFGPVPFAAMMLADMGSEIVRVDRVPKSPEDNNGFGGFENRGRTSIAIDLKNPKGIEVVLRLMEDADVLLEGFRPGVMEKLGLGPEVCMKRNPRLVFGRMTGWGQSGPLSSAAGHDLNYIALTGALHTMGWSDRPPTPPLNLIGDYGGGAMMLLAGVLAALYERQSSGQGQVIDAAMTDGVATLLSPIYSMMAQGMWKDQRNVNHLDGGAHFYGVYECADAKFISVGPIEPHFYQLLLQKCGIDATEFQNQYDAKTWPELRAKLGIVFKTRTRAEWCELMEGTDICFAPVLSLHEAPQHPHNIARQAFAEVDGDIQPAPSPRFSRTPSRAPKHVPDEGEHSIATLANAGFSEREIAQLIAEGAVYSAEPAQQSDVPRKRMQKIG